MPRHPLCGEKDCPNRAAKQLKKLLPQAELLIVPGAGHESSINPRRKWSWNCSTGKDNPQQIRLALHTPCRNVGLSLFIYCSTLLQQDAVIVRFLPAFS